VETSCFSHTHTHRTGLKVYRYEVPWYIAYPHALDDWEFGLVDLYRGFEAFFEQFASDNVVRGLSSCWLRRIEEWLYFSAQGGGSTSSFVQMWLLYIPVPYPHGLYLQTRTENPHEANLFYVPLLLFYISDNADNPYGSALRGLEWISKTYPQVRYI